MIKIKPSRPSTEIGVTKCLLIFPLLFIFSCSSGISSTNKTSSSNFDEVPQQRKVSTSTSNRKSAKNFPKLSLDFLFEGKKGESNLASQRNISSMEEDPEVVAERKKQEEEARKKAEEAQKKAEEERKKREEELKINPPPPKPPEITFDLIGYLGPGGKRIGVFKMKGSDEIILKGDKEKIDDQFIVVEIGYESAKIGFEGFEETKSIPLISGGK